MKECPILFSAPMVRALLDGSKTQTRRVVKKSEQWPASAVKAVMLETRGTALAVDAKRCTYGPEIKCPYGQPGDRLWVRETFAEGVHQMCDANHWVYAADPFGDQGRLGDKWKPSIFMPRCASRITLEITGVRVERLQDINEMDAIAEGIYRLDYAGQISWQNYSLTDDEAVVSPMLDSPIDSYRTLWESINSDGSWDLNPWVWVIEFKKVQA